MTFDQIAIVVVFAAALALFISERVRYDLVALSALLAAVLLGLVRPAAAFSGFANDAVITVAAVLVMSHGLARSGAVDTVTVPLLRAATHPVALMAGLCVIGALLSSFMNNVGALALLMPIAIAGARKGGYSATLLLMPLSFATLLGGTMTLIGTPPNLLIAEIAERLRGERFTMFEFMPVGAALTVSGVVFIAAIGWRLLPRGREGAKSPTELFEIGHYVTEARLPAKSPLIGKTIRDFEDASKDRAIVLGLLHGDTRLRPSSLYVLQEGDVLLLQAETEALQEYVKAAHIDLSAAEPRGAPDLPSAEASVPVPAVPAAESAKPGKGAQRPTARQLLDTAEAVVTPTSWVQGSTARTLRLRARYDANLLAISRGGRPITTRLRDVPLHAGDVLLPFAIFGGAIALVILGVTSPAIAFVMGAVAMVVFGFLPAREVYSTIEWPVIVLLAALIPVAAALETTGTAQLAADGLVAVAGTLTPHAMLALVLVATMVLTPILNNAATVLLMGPIAFGVAENIGVDSAAFLMAVAIGASCDFLTPFGHQNNTLILGPGGYRFADFWRLGLPLDAIVLLVAVPLLPIVFPF